jgi:K(+)-stimulated pyrophosphate-energized sodium pump
MFMRVSGGIYTKAADVGADIVGKTEAGIPEDDPRNPAVIADNVGDNVGDCAGMGADVYESFVVIAIAAVILGALLAKNTTALAALGVSTPSNLALFPITLGGAGIVGSIFGGLYIRSSIKSKPMSALNTALVLTAIISIIIDYVFTFELFPNSDITWALFGSTVIGVIVVYLIEKVADYYTSYSFPPVKFIAESSQTSAATNFLAGFCGA